MYSTSLDNFAPFENCVTLEKISPLKNFPQFRNRW